MPVVIERHGRPRVEGTAFSVMPNVAITAAHVVISDGRPRGDAGSLLYLGGTYADGGLMGGLLPIEQVAFDPKHDVALLRYALPEINGELLRVKHLQLDLTAPTVGNTCLAIGYTAKFDFEMNGQSLPTFTVNPKLHASKGVIEDVHLEGRDPVMLPFPVFRTDSHIVSQMSGGPIFSGPIGTHHVVGVVASSYEVKDSPSLSYGSLLSVGLDLRLTFNVDGTVRLVTLRDMVARGGIHTKS